MSSLVLFVTVSLNGQPGWADHEKPSRRWCEPGTTESSSRTGETPVAARHDPHDPVLTQSTLPGAPYLYHQTREAHAWVRVPDLGELIG